MKGYEYIRKALYFISTFWNGTAPVTVWYFLRMYGLL